MGFSLFNHPISVNTNELLKSVEFRFEHGSELHLKSSAKVPTDLLFLPSGEGQLSIDGPFISSDLDIHGRWFNAVSVEAKLVFDAVLQLSRQETDTILIWSNLYGLVLKAATKVRLPHILAYHRIHEGNCDWYEPDPYHL